METVNIRIAHQGDVASLCQLVLAFHEFHVAGVPDRLNSLQNTFDKSDLQNRLFDIIAQENAVIFVAEKNGRLLGFIELYLRQDESNPAKAAYRYALVQSLMVEQSKRTCGIGTQLMQTAQQWANKHDADEVRLDVWEFDSGPLPFYEKLGYHTLRRQLVYKLCKQKGSSH